MAAPIRSDFCTFDREFGTILEIGRLLVQPEFDLDGRLGTINQNEKNKVSSTLLSLRLDAQPTVTY